MMKNAEQKLVVCKKANKEKHKIKRKLKKRKEKIRPGQ